VITGSSSAIGGELTANPLVRKLSFTGSTEIGKVLMQQCAGTVKKFSMELGGNGRCLQVSQHRTDLCLRQPLSGTGRDI